MTFTTQSHTSTGEKTIISVDLEKFNHIAVSAPDTAIYEIQFQLDGTGLRHAKVTENGSTELFMIGVDGVGINITDYTSGTVTFEVLDNLDIAGAA